MRSKAFKHIVLVWILLMAGGEALAQQLWADVTVNRQEVIVGEPIELTITVYTSTFFTRGPNPGNIKINGAFSVYFRPVSKSFRRSGNTYAGVQLKYKVFPYEVRTLEIPEMEISVATPAEGQYKGTDRVVKTQAKTVVVNPVPDQYDREGWLVAGALNVSDRNAGRELEFKVGEVFERTISRYAAGTVSEMIPPVLWDSLPGVSIYPDRPQINTSKSKTNISATRVDKVQYLFEKEGEFEIPAMEFKWYNPYRKQVYTKSLNAIKVRVLPNADLGLLTSVKDSLKVAAIPEEVTETEEKPLTIMGMSLRAFLLFLAGLLILLYLLYRILKMVVERRKERRIRYRASEAWYFDRFLKAHRQGRLQASINDLYRWLDVMGVQPATVEEVKRRTGLPGLGKEQELIDAVARGTSSGKLNAGLWKKVRKQLNEGSAGVSSGINWINPGSVSR